MSVNVPLIDDTPGQPLRGFSKFHPTPNVDRQIKQFHDLQQNAAQIVRKLEAELATAKAALRNYGRHKGWCVYTLSGAACDCGWFAILRDACASKNES